MVTVVTVVAVCRADVIMIILFVLDMATNNSRISFFGLVVLIFALRERDHLKREHQTHC